MDTNFYFPQEDTDQSFLPVPGTSCTVSRIPNPLAEPSIHFHQYLLCRCLMNEHNLHLSLGCWNSCRYCLIFVSQIFWSRSTCYRLSCRGQLSSAFLREVMFCSTCSVTFRICSKIKSPIDAIFRAQFSRFLPSFPFYEHRPLTCFFGSAVFLFLSLP